MRLLPVVLVFLGLVLALGGLGVAFRKSAWTKASIFLSRCSG
jgi:hypothetical protein